jgi:prepilin-type processing-associated H-X9-DG protein
MKSSNLSMFARWDCCARSQSGFTIVELLAVLVTVTLLSCAMATTMAGSRADGSAVQCRNNLRQICVAWTMYAEDNREQLVYNHDSGVPGLAPGNEEWVAGWLDFGTGQPSGADTNIAMLVDHVRYPYGAYLGPYLKSPSVFKCPADRTTINFGGIKTPRVRSVSMNNYVGSNARAWNRTGGNSVYTNLARIKAPSSMFVILDERADSINDGCFFSDASTAHQLIDWPGNFHNGRGSFSFADTHAETHPWKDPRTAAGFYAGNLLEFNLNLPNNPDIPWLQRSAIGAVTAP